jgi:hypothetical protein
MKRLNAEFTLRGYEGFKFAAASTMVEQPNDVGHIHKSLKTHYKGKKYSAIKTWEIPPYLIGFDRTLADAGMDSGSVRTYWKALCHLETYLNKVCTIPMVKEGFRISGIFPIDNDAILSGWSGWSLCSKETADEVIELLPNLTAIVQVNGRVTDSEIEECMGHLLQFDENTRKADNCALNHGRCLWTNNEKVVNTYNEKLLLEAQKKADKENKEIEKGRRLFSPDRDASEDNLMRSRSNDVPDVSEAGENVVKRARLYRCSNSSCRTTAFTAGRREWKRCKKKGCGLAFCVSCETALSEHQYICDKGLHTGVIV